MAWCGAGLIPPNSDPRGWTRAEVAASMDRVQQESAGAFSRFTHGFYAALDDARHVVGRCMAHVMLTVRPETLTFGRGRRALPGSGRRARTGIDHVRICWTISSGARSIRARF